jgi:hypothetical protein
MKVSKINMVYIKIKSKKNTYFAVTIPSVVFIKATSSTVKVAIGIIVFIITPHIIGPLWGSTTILRWGCSAWWCSGGWWWGGCWSWWRGSSSTLNNEKLVKFSDKKFIL